MKLSFCGHRKLDMAKIGATAKWFSTALLYDSILIRMHL